MAASLSTSLGHCHPGAGGGADRAGQQLWHVSNARLLMSRHLRFGAQIGGRPFAERCSFAILAPRPTRRRSKLARKVASDRDPARDEIIAASNGFHGRTFCSPSALAGQPKYSEGFGPRPQAISHVPYNDIAALRGGERAHLLRLWSNRYRAKVACCRPAASICKRRAGGRRTARC